MIHANLQFHRSKIVEIIVISHCPEHRAISHANSQGECKAFRTTPSTIPENSDNSHTRHEALHSTINIHGEQQRQLVCITRSSDACKVAHICV